MRRVLGINLARIPVSQLASHDDRLLLAEEHTKVLLSRSGGWALAADCGPKPILTISSLLYINDFSTIPTLR